MAIETYWITRWRDEYRNKWHNSTWEGDMPSEAEARAQLEHDINYFYSDVPIQLVKVTEEVVSEHHGKNERAKS